MIRFLFVLTAIFVPLPSLQAADLVAGPMPGHSAMRAVKIWAQTDAPASVALRYWPDGKQRLARTTQPVAATPASAFAVEIDVIDLEPGTGYAYRVLIDGEPVPPVFEQRFQTQPLWQWRNDPPAFSFALGSCAYVNQREYDRPGQPYGGDYQVFDAIAVEQPDFMLWLGDNVYYREADWHSVSAMYARYSHTRQLHELQRLLSSTHHYATWDDHDYGPNDSDSSYRLREQALKIFGDFWPNPEFDSTAGGVTHHFEWHDAAFFMLDNRYFRQANGRVTGQRTVLGREQIGWLLDALKSSSASFKFVVMGGQFLNSAETGENYINLAPGERREILDRIDAEDIPGVLFLSGDRHHSVLMKKENGVDYPLYEWTVSPLTAGPSSPSAGENQYRVPGSLFERRGFGFAEIRGPRDDRVLRLGLHDSDGERIWMTEIFQRDLR